MPCSDTHFTPIPFDPAPGFGNPDGEAGWGISENLRPSEPALSGAEGAKKGRWGGARPGAGAPKGNLNALRHGRNSRYQRQLVQLLAQIPQARDALIQIAKRRRRQQKQVETGAALLLAELLRRVGEIVLNPEDNRLENNRELLHLLRTTEAQLREMLDRQSTPAA